ncbi:MAG TPA: hypothetical protein VGP72_11380 [Planctomycetota bacterium]|jgi:hypothetical protein
MADPTRRSTRFSMRSKQLGQLLLENGDVRAEHVAQALKVQEKEGGLIGQILQRMGACPPPAIAAALLKQVQVTDVKCDELEVPPEVSILVERELCEAEKLCPFEKLGGLLCLIMANPLNRKAITAIEERTHLKVKSFKSIWTPISALIQRTYGEGEAAFQPPLEAQPIEAGDPYATAEIAAPEPLPPLEIQPSADIAAPIEIAAPTQIPLPNDFGVGPAPVTTRSGSLASIPRKPQRQPEQPAHKIDNIDTLDESKAEVIDTNTRTRKAAEPEVVAPKPVKVAKVNIDLDSLDVSKADVVVPGAALPGEEALEEIAHAPAQALAAATPVEALVSLALVEDRYFYADGKAPEGARSDELLRLVEQLPVAEVIAESAAEYQQKQKGVSAVQAAVEAKPLPPALRARPVELQPAPAVPMQAVVLGEDEFQQQVVALVEDPVGEWDWQFAAAGPVAAVDYEE